MTPTEHLVEVYYRICKDCLTSNDIKVIHGNNRQFDIIAYNKKTDEIRHIEVSVTHYEKWTSTLKNLFPEIDYKFFGNPKNKRPENKKTDFNKNKNYKKEIEATYNKMGFKWDEVIRVWCLWWYQNDPKTVKIWKKELAKKYHLQEKNFELLSLRDEVFPSLIVSIGTSNYSDDISRTISLMSQYEKQKNLK
jgi:hypothetical protein